jgi:ubiquinone/menaquinone biosynthesis C-methylase UbiE
MRDPWRLNERLFAWFYPHLLERSERAGQRETRRALIAEAHGRTLELGAGSGANLPHYTAAVSELVISDPSPEMRAHLRRALEAAGGPPLRSATLIDCGAQQLPFESESFDTVVATYILCTVPEPERALAEIARVLRPGGRYLFLEHVRDSDGTLLARFQDLVEAPHVYLAAGCHPNRRTAGVIERSPLRVQRLEHGRQPRSLPSVRPTILGTAVRE